MENFKVYFLGGTEYLYNVNSGKKYKWDILKYENYLSHIISNDEVADNWYKTKEFWDNHLSPRAWEYHYMTSNINFYDYSTDYNHYEVDIVNVNNRNKNELVPALFKNYNRNKFEVLEVNSPKLSNESLSFGDLYIPEESTCWNIESIIEYIAGIQFFSTSRYKEINHVRRASPSGGAKHLVETYIFDFEKKYIQHFNFVNKTFQNIGKLQVLPIEAFPLIKENEEKFSKFIVFTSMYKRNMFKYRDSRTYRPAHIETGHHLAMYSSILKKQNYTFVKMVNPNSIIVNDVLKINGFDECAIAAIAVKESYE